MQPLANVCIRWRSPEENGRQSGPPPGPIFAATARLDGDSEDFSVILRLSERVAGNGQAVQQAEFNLLHADALPEIAAQLVPGRQLTIREGRRIVADCEVRSVRLVETGIHF